MANILDFLRGLLTDGGAQQRFNGNPSGYVADHGFTDLSGEDVTEAIRVLARTLPEDTSARLSCYTNGDGELPPVRPQHGESELDAAIRQLRFAISLSPAAGPTDMEETEPEPVAEEFQAPTEPASDPRWEGERQPVSVHTETESTTEPAPVSAFDPYAAFGDEMAAIVRNASDQMQAVLARAEAIVRNAEREAEGIRESALVDAQAVRGKANQEADGILQEARTQREEAGAELTSARNTREEAERDATAMMNEARSRREEIRAAEEELRKRLEGVQSVFQSFQQGSVVPEERHPTD
jgi:hypothetical protein